MAAFWNAASTLMAPPDPTETLPAGYLLLRFGENTRRNLMLLHDAALQALASIEIQRWIDACACTLLQGNRSLLLLLPLTLPLLSAQLKLLSEMVAGAPPRFQQENVRLNPHRRHLTAFSDPEEDARLTLHRRNRCRHCRGQRDVDLRNEKSREHLSAFRRIHGFKKPNDELVAARVIQRWIRTKFQPWVAVHKTLRPPSPVDSWTDRDTGALVVTMVDSDFTSFIERSCEPPLADFELHGLRTSPAAPPVDEDDGVHGTSSYALPTRRGAATMSCTRLFPSRDDSDGLFVEEALPVLQAIATAPPEDGRQ